MGRKSKKIFNLFFWKKVLWTVGILEILLGMGLLGLGNWLLSLENHLPLLGSDDLVSPKDLSDDFLVIFLILSLFCFFWVGLGAGTLLALRWVRTLILAFSWLWICHSFLLMLGCFENFVWPRTEDHPMSMGFSVKFIGSVFVFGVFFPLMLMFFYGNRNVKKICETENPKKSWTESCSLPMLVFILYEIESVVLVLSVPPFFHFTTLFFGFLFTGFLGGTVILIKGLVGLYLVWGFYRQKIGAWWTAVVWLFAQTISSLWTSSGTRAAFDAAVMPNLKLDKMEEPSIIAVVLGLILGLVVLLFLRRYFKPDQFSRFLKLSLKGLKGCFAVSRY